MLIILNTSKL